MTWKDLASLYYFHALWNSHFVTLNFFGLTFIFTVMLCSQIRTFIFLLNNWFLIHIHFVTTCVKLSDLIKRVVGWATNRVEDLGNIFIIMHEIIRWVNLKMMLLTSQMVWIENWNRLLIKWLSPIIRGTSRNLQG